MLEEAGKHIGICFVPVGKAFAQSDNCFSEKMNPLVGSLIGHVIADFVLWLHSAIVDHSLGGMALNFGDGDGVGSFGLDVLVVEVPKVSILLECPWSLGHCVIVDVVMDRQCFRKKALAVGAKVYWPVGSKGNNCSSNL